MIKTAEDMVIMSWPSTFENGPNAQSANPAAVQIKEPTLFGSPFAAACAGHCSGELPDFTHSSKVIADTPTGAIRVPKSKRSIPAVMIFL